MIQKKEKQTKEEKRLLSKGKKATEILEGIYPDAVCSLDYGNDPWRLLVTVRLSAQCTDKRVNEISPALFAKYPDCASMSVADITELEEIIRPCGLYHSKAESIIAFSKEISEKYDGIPPDSLEKLCELPGVGRKSANLIMGDVYGKGGIVADTHCMRICGRLGFYKDGKKDPLFTEKTMDKYIARNDQSGFCHRLVNFGRDVCTARNPKCTLCPLSGICDYYTENEE